MQNYISSVFNREDNVVLVWERPVLGGDRSLRVYKAPWYFFIQDQNGTEKGIDGQSLTRLDFDSRAEFELARKKFGQCYESDIRADAKVLMDYYYDRPTPIVHYAFLDIEVDYTSTIGFAEVDDPYAPVNAITIFKSWLGKYVTFAIPPKGLTTEADLAAVKAKILEQAVKYKLEFTPDVKFFFDEQDLFNAMFEEIEDADIVSGWNSLFYDIPYLVNRAKRIFNPNEIGSFDPTARFCFRGAPSPIRREVMRFGAPHTTYDLNGRTHLDYKDLYEKFTFEGHTSYKLANIAAEEIDAPKLEYDGTLEHLYKGTYEPDVSNLSLSEAIAHEQDDDRVAFCEQRAILRRAIEALDAGELLDPELNLDRDTLVTLYQEADLQARIASFAYFCTYNMRDVEVLVKLDKKLKLMQLVNQMAHENTVPFTAILGTVRYVETGITNRAHNVHRLRVPDKKLSKTKNKKVEGAIVMTPLAGLHKFLGSVDIESLYPSTIRALNMSIETFIGQFEGDDAAWYGIMHGDQNVKWTCTFRDGSTATATAAEWVQYFKDEKYALSGFGTIFDQKVPGMVADTLTFWFSERKRLKNEKKIWDKKAEKLRAELGQKVDKCIDDRFFEDGKQYTEDEWNQIQAAEKEAEHYDLLQLTKKIQLNSTYGALLNEAFKFGRREIGASVTGTGRQITSHMAKTIAELRNPGRPVRLMKRFVPGQFKDIECQELGGLAEMKAWKKRARREGEEVEDMFARARKNNDMEFLLNLPKEVQYNVEKDDDGNEYVAPTAALYWPMFLDTNEDCNDIIYGDTDSCYFSTGEMNYDAAVSRADEIAEQVNASFPEFMHRNFNSIGGNEKLIKAAREVVGEAGLFMFAKKKYTIKVVNLDGKDLRAHPKQKSMGSEIKKADTPKVVQNFLKELMDHVLDGADYDKLERFVNDHRGKLITKKNAILLAPAKQVNSLDEYTAEFNRVERDGFGRAKLPGNVRAAINFNLLLEEHDTEREIAPIKTGDKAAILYVKPNNYGMKSIGVPSEITALPRWFSERFEVDLDLTEQKMIDSKIDSIFKVLGYETPTPHFEFLRSAFDI
jgi:DNA polymerase elongation subunit (family B)